ncbi:hypothetical protein ACS0TY_014663 [Phlomoides rotata]
MASSTAPTQDSNATPCFQSPVDGTPQTMSVDEIPTPNDSNQVNCMDESEETLVLGKKGGLTSVVWNHFKRQQIKGKWKAECNFCKKTTGRRYKKWDKTFARSFEDMSLEKHKRHKAVDLDAKERYWWEV